MADKKISDLAAASSVADADLFLIETSGGHSRKVAGSVVRAGMQGLLGITKLHKTATQSIATGAWRTVTWDVEDYDNLNAVNLGGSSSNIVVPSGITYARASLLLIWANNSTSTRAAQLTDGSGDMILAEIKNAAIESISCLSGGWMPVVAGRTFTLQVNSGSQTLNLGSFNNPYSHLTIEWAASLADLVRA